MLAGFFGMLQGGCIMRQQLYQHNDIHGQHPNEIQSFLPLAPPQPFEAEEKRLRGAGYFIGSDENQGSNSQFLSI